MVSDMQPSPPLSPAFCFVLAKGTGSLADDELCRDHANSTLCLSCAGATFGLYTALTGVKLPGQATAVAEGNALGKGALVYHLYPSALQIIQDRASGQLARPFTTFDVNDTACLLLMLYALPHI